MKLRHWHFALLLLVSVLVASVAIGVALNLRDEDRLVEVSEAPAATPALVERGAYLARAGNCMTCHTPRGGAPYSGGRGIETPFGTVYSSNLTPDPQTGIGGWSAGHFWRALHNGRSRDGRLLYPAFPYPNYTQVTREDSDAIFAYLRSLPAVDRPNREHALRFPYNSQAALAVWRALFFEPGVYEPEPGQSAQWNRGGYLVRGLGHCNACHASRNIFGATQENLELSGGLIPMQNWYAPSLSSAREAGVAEWEAQHVVDLMQSGISPRGAVLGPMAEVVYSSTQFLSREDLQAMAVFLKALPQASIEGEGKGVAVDLGFIARFFKRAPPDPTLLLARGQEIYDKRCADCHGAQGQGAPGAYPGLAGNRALTMASPANLVRVVLSGGFPPATAGNPRPYGMPPFGHELNDADVAAVLTFIRSAWGNDAGPVWPRDVLALR